MYDETKIYKYIKRDTFDLLFNTFYHITTVCKIKHTNMYHYCNFKIIIQQYNIIVIPSTLNYTKQAILFTSHELQSSKTSSTSDQNHFSWCDKWPKKPHLDHSTKSVRKHSLTAQFCLHDSSEITGKANGDLTCLLRFFCPVQVEISTTFQTVLGSTKSLQQNLKHFSKDLQRIKDRRF